jgi:hypothetical protein
MIGEHVVDGLRLVSTHHRSRYMVLQPHSHAFHVFDFYGILFHGFSQWLTHLVVIAFLIA